MTNKTVLTDEQITEQFEWYVDDPEHTNTFMGFARAIEQAVLQTPEIQALQKDAERYRWLLENCYRWPANGGHCNEFDQSEPVALWVKRKVGDDPCAAIDHARRVEEQK